MKFDREMQRALEADGEKLRQLTGQDHGPVFLAEDEEDGSELPDADYLRDLAERLRHIPVMHGTNDGDISRLYEIAKKLSEEDEL